jgi:hypothetical protein
MFLPFSLWEKVPEGRIRVRESNRLTKYTDPHPNPSPGGEGLKHVMES